MSLWIANPLTNIVSNMRHTNLSVVVYMEGELDTFQLIIKINWYKGS